uniref:Uncharacterized protein n=1 Tax=Vitis vinifera TaxID=29760 RepID=F6I710_VITVI
MVVGLEVPTSKLKIWRCISRIS